MSETNKKIERLRALVYPDRCCFCGKVIPFDSEVCSSCLKTVPLIEYPKCHSCGKSRSECECGGKSNFYEEITAPYEYKGVVKRGIKLWKYNDAKKSVIYFSKAVCLAISKDFGDVKFDYITFIPQTKKESAERGFNQCESLALEIGKLMSLPVYPVLKKIFDTDSQHNMPWFRRSGNVFGIFDCCGGYEIKGKTILLVDDIKTSGNTMNECAKMLSLYGAGKIYCAAIAIT